MTDKKGLEFINSAMLETVTDERKETLSERLRRIKEDNRQFLEETPVW